MTLPFDPPEDPMPAPEDRRIAADVLDVAKLGDSDQFAEAIKAAIPGLVEAYDPGRHVWATAPIHRASDLHPGNHPDDEGVPRD